MENVKFYSTKANANRAAKAKFVEFTTVEVEGKGWKILELEAKPVAPVVAEIGNDVYAYNIHGLLNCPHHGCHLSNGIGEHMGEVNGNYIKHDKYQFKCLACNQEFGPEILKPLKGSKATHVVTNFSTVERPCKKVWWIADEMITANPNVKRGAVLAECVKQGIAFYTARTQYQQWLSVRKEMAEREAQQAAK
jgi:hypothetical protein